MTTCSRTASEKVLLDVLRRANLSQYYDAFISQGGDDVPQLCEAGEEEFLEIMALVGMASKPLHVRRLQKALHEWLINPDIFKEPNNCTRLPKSTSYQNHPGFQGNLLNSTQSPNQQSINQQSSFIDSVHISSEHSARSLPYMLQFQSNGRHTYQSTSPTSESSEHEVSYGTVIDNKGDSTFGSPWACRLTDVQRTTIERNADELSHSLPFYAPKPLNMKKPIDKEIDEVMNLAEDDPNRMDLMRKYSAIYGRFDSKRKVEKHMNFHEMCVNEAAAQLCKHRPSLLTRREDLFVLARQVVRDSGYQIAKPPLYKSMEVSLEGSPQKNSNVTTSSWMNSVASEYSHNSRPDSSASQEWTRLDESTDVPSSLVDVGLCVARQYGLDGLEEELLREIKKPTLDSRKKKQKNRVLCK
jgi:hypothetical protein